MKDTGKILHNRYVLYFVLFLALSDLMFLAMGSEFISVAVFILSGFVTSFFSKNMMVIMCIAMVITNILRYGTGIRLMEGLKEGAAPPAVEEPTATALVAEEPDTPVTAPAPATAVKTDRPPRAAAVKTVEKFSQEQKFLENMEKLESYQPLLQSMDRLMEGVSKLIKL